MSVVVGEDTCQLCGREIGPGEEVRRTSGAGSIDSAGRVRYMWQHVGCESTPTVFADVEPPPWQEWIRLMCSDPAGAAQRLHELEARVAALEKRR